MDDTDTTHWLVKDFHALYRAAKAAADEQMKGQGGPAFGFLVAQLQRLQPAFEACKFEQRILDPEVRAAEKQASRDRDAADLASGAKTRAQLWAENTMMPARMTMVDLLSIPVPEDSNE